MKWNFVVLDELFKIALVDFVIEYCLLVWQVSILVDLCKVNKPWIQLQVIPSILSVTLNTLRIHRRNIGHLQCIFIRHNHRRLLSHGLASVLLVILETSLSNLLLLNLKHLAFILKHLLHLADL